jgi:regulatory protein YycH of two-component signal transduction system YycFG
MENSNEKSFTTTIIVDQSPEEAYSAINNVREWWTGKIEGDTDKVGGEFTYNYKDLHYSKQEIMELTPGKKVVWHVVDASLNFTQDKGEWIGTDIVFDISKKGDKTEIRFTHVGLIPKMECFKACEGGWSFYINGSLKSLIETGKGKIDD